MDYVRYLAAKRSVDNRALNESVMQSFRSAIVSASDQNPRPSLCVLEVGAGIGAMVVRLAQNGTFDSLGTVAYHLVDIKPEVLIEARALIARELCPKGAIQGDARTAPVVLRNSAISGDRAVHHAAGAEDALGSVEAIHPLPAIRLPGGASLACTFEVGDGLVHADEHPAAYDVVVASAVLDLFDIGNASRRLLSSLRRQRCSPRSFLFTLTFDGTTCFLPARTGDDVVEAAFHKAMGADGEDGGAKAQAGRRLLEPLVNEGAQSIVGGSSSWLVRPEHGAYQQDERFFVECILDYIERSARKVEAHVVEAKGWMDDRLQQLADGRLMYIAHNMDYTGQVSPAK